MSKIWGIGVDVISISRIRICYSKYNDRFLKRILHNKEIEQFRSRSNKEEYLAGRWAYKEAAYKAMGSHRLFFPDVYLDYVNTKPRLQFTGNSLEFIRKNGIATSHVSISHDSDTCIAMVILEQL